MGGRITILCPHVFGLKFQVGFHFVREKYVVLELNLLKKVVGNSIVPTNEFSSKPIFDERYIS